LDQPESVRDPEFLGRVRDLVPDVAVVVAFGQIFPPALLEIPAAGCINLHASLLPRHRGAAPIQAAIVAGDEVTGVTTMLMDEGLDTGPRLLTEEVRVGAKETAGELATRLAAVGGALVLRTLAALEQGTLQARPQDDTKATLAPMLDRKDGRVDWVLSAVAIVRRLRAFTPWPGCFARLRDERVKILEAHVGETPTPIVGNPGSYLGLGGDGLVVQCGSESIVVLDRVQRPGRRAVSGRDFANGLRLEPGEQFD